jgi:hypothetical protein
LLEGIYMDISSTDLSEILWHGEKGIWREYYSSIQFPDLPGSAGPRPTTTRYVSTGAATDKGQKLT